MAGRSRLLTFVVTSLVVPVVGSCAGRYDTVAGFADAATSSPADASSSRPDSDVGFPLDAASTTSDAAPSADSGSDSGASVLFRDDFDRPGGAIGGWAAVELQGSSNVRILRPGALGASVLNTTTPRTAGTVAAFLRATRARPSSATSFSVEVSLMVRVLDPLAGPETTSLVSVAYGPSSENAVVVAVQGGKLILRGNHRNLDGGETSVIGPTLVLQKTYRAKLSFDGAARRVSLRLDGVVAATSDGWPALEGSGLDLRLGVLEMTDPPVATSVEYDDFVATAN